MTTFSEVVCQWLLPEAECVLVQGHLICFVPKVGLEPVCLFTYVIYIATYLTEETLSGLQD